jgi:GNAT superfamily N-acetyltransferase
MKLRAATIADLPFLRLMMREAGFPPGRQPPLDEALRAPHVAQWLDGWMRDGDFGVVASDDADAPLGAVWCRRFVAGGYPNWGLVDEATPVLAIAVADGQRGRGLGRALLDAIADAARERGHRALSLNVGRTNRARELYARAGFVELDDAPDRPLRMLLTL